MTPLLKFFFTVSYVAFAAFVGAFADSMAKGRVMFITNTVKIVGCALMFFHELWEIPGAPPYLTVLLAYTVVGLGAAAYSPAKYGILTEYLPHHKLVVANGWIEGLTVSSIILGTLLGGVLISQTVSRAPAHLRPAGHRHRRRHAGRSRHCHHHAALRHRGHLQSVHPGHRRRSPATPSKNPWYLVREFAHCVKLLWTDKLGQISLATTTLFWGAGATLQFIVLKWAEVALGYTLSQATVLQGICAVGIAAGSVIAAKVRTAATAPSTWYRSASPWASSSSR